ncbi:MAG: triose-phosphate isomerase [Patescibacteria group bacterium]
MKKLIIANWKMTPSTAKEAEETLGEIQKSMSNSKNTEVVICPPFVYLDRLSGGVKIKLGAQDLFWEKSGSYTGEISAPMLKSLGVKYIIIGHSERRENFGETNEIVNKKIKMALKSNLKTVLCVGEKERDEKAEYLKFIKREIVEGLAKIPRKDLENLIICYEPIWAISGRKDSQADTPESFRETSIYIKKVLFLRYGRKVSRETPILYGGSVDAKNAKDFLEKGQVDGLLIGRASWKAKSFTDLLKSL